MSNPLDAGDPQADPFRPPKLSTIVHCIHCGEEYDSYRIEWRVELCDDGRNHGFWCCPIEGCDGRGFGFDIFPVDPEYRDEHGNKMWSDDEDEDEEDYPEEELPPDNPAPEPNGHNGSGRVDPINEEDIPW